VLRPNASTHTINTTTHTITDFVEFVTHSRRWPRCEATSALLHSLQCQFRAHVFHFSTVRYSATHIFIPAGLDRETCSTNHRHTFYSLLVRLLHYKIRPPPPESCISSQSVEQGPILSIRSQRTVSCSVPSFTPRKIPLHHCHHRRLFIDFLSASSGCTGFFWP
jgi:hypothetical protein